MTIFNPGTGETLNSTTVEAAFIEACQLLQDEEKAIDELTNNIAVNYFTCDNVVQIGETFPLVQSIDEVTGKPTFSTTEFITTTFANRGGDLKRYVSTATIFIQGIRLFSEKIYLNETVHINIDKSGSSYQLNFWFPWWHREINLQIWQNDNSDNCETCKTLDRIEKNKIDNIFDYSI